MKILVTGGAGFIGSNYIYYILDKYSDYEIICVDDLTYAGNGHTLEKLINNSRFKFYKINICDRNNIYKIFEVERPNIVINFAAETHVDRSITTPEIFLTTNILGAQVLMDACLKYGNIRFHQVSTDEVYGDLPLDRSDLLFTEETPVHTSSPYSASKASADLLVLAYNRTYSLPVTISRCSNNYGPYQFPEKLVPLMISNCLLNEDLPVYGTGENVRDWLYVIDHCEAIDLIIHNSKIGKIYNIGGNNERRNIDIVKIIKEAVLNSKSEIIFVEDRKGHDKRYAIDSTKIQNDLNWKPKTSFNEGIYQTIQWYMDNKKWLNNILSGEYMQPPSNLILRLGDEKAHE